MNKNIIISVLALMSATTLSSCLISQAVQTFTRDPYPGQRPPMVIRDNNGRPASQKWLRTDSDMLPPSGHMKNRITTASDGIPYGLTSEFSNVVVSPYAPYHQLDYTGIAPGSKVWDPYTRKPFYIKRSFTFN